MMQFHLVIVQFESIKAKKSAIKLTKAHIICYIITNYLLTMECVINQTLKDFIRKGKKPEAVREYIAKRYNISIGMEALKRRIQMLKPEVRV